MVGTQGPAAFGSETQWYRIWEAKSGCRSSGLYRPGLNYLIPSTDILRSLYGSRHQQGRVGAAPGAATVNVLYSSMFSSRDNVKSEPILFASGVGVRRRGPAYQGGGVAPATPPFRQKQVEKGYHPGAVNRRARGARHQATRTPYACGERATP